MNPPPKKTAAADSYSSITDYYAHRAAEYERIYEKPERQTDLGVLHTLIAEKCTELDLLEIACGTGYWTQSACRAALSIVATDYNEAVLNIARQKDYGTCPVTFLETDAYNLDEVAGCHTGVLAGFWWSHVPKERLRNFLRTLHSKLVTGARIIVLDNRYVEGSSTPISRTDRRGNTYQERTLADGSIYEVIKNFPTRGEFFDRIEPFAREPVFTELDFFWLAEYILKAPAGDFQE